MQPLDGVQVLDLSRFIAGPFCSMLLADQGASVIKVERLRGEDSRQLGPFWHGTSLYFTTYNRNKRSLALNLRDERGKALLWELVRRSDVLVENFRPGTLAEMGMAYEALSDANPRLVLTSVSGFGQAGPYRDRPAFDAIAQAMSGLMGLTGDAATSPLLSGTYLADFTAGMYAALGTMFALRERDRTGLGQHVDIALLDSVFSILATAVPEYLTTGQVQPRSGNRDRVSVPANAYRARDGWVYLHAGTDALWPRLARAMGRPELVTDGRCSDVQSRLAHEAEVEELVADWVRQQTVEQVVAAAERAGFPCAEVASIPDVVRNPQLQSRQMLAACELPGVGQAPLPGSPIKLSRTPFVLRHRPPRLGEHSREVVCELLGHSPEEFEQLVQGGVVATEAAPSQQGVTPQGGI